MYYLHSSHNSLTCLLSTTNCVIVLFVRVWKELTTFLKFFDETMTQETVQRRFLKCFSLRGALKVVSRYAWKTEGDLPRCVSTPMPAGVELCPLTRQRPLLREKEPVRDAPGCFLSRSPWLFSLADPNM